MFENKKIATTIEQGVTFLAAQQEKDGRFLSLSFEQSENAIKATTYNSVFSTALILDILNNLSETPIIAQLKKKAASFLVEQKSEHWSFNYWVRNSEETKTMPYPDDLDDTFCALAGLTHYDGSLIDGSAMAQIVRILTAVEVKEGGPYRTWLVGKKSDKRWRDVDIAVNSNIAYFLSLNNISLPKLTAFIEKCITKEQLTSPYYPSIYPVIYFISRFYKGKYTTKLRELLLSKQHENHTWGNPLKTALAISSLLNLGYDPNLLHKSIISLIQASQNGSWEPYGFCIDPTINGKIHYSGSSALTTAFCLEALNKYMVEQKRNNQNRKQQEESEKLIDEVRQRIEKIYGQFDKKFQKNAFSLVNKLIKNDKSKQIPLMPYYFSLTLGEKRKDIPDGLLSTLGTANVLGWIAYTIYDDFLDNEGTPVMLPIANVALRELTSIFEHILPDSIEFQAFFHTVMDQLDEANAWEVSNCRLTIRGDEIEGGKIKLPHYGTYERLAYKSLGHGLGPIAILFSLGYTWNSREIKSLANFFKHYLIAKQLNDDANDWEEDLKMGHINPVCALLLKKIYATHIENVTTISLNNLLPIMQKLFWDEVIDEVCGTIYKNTHQGKKHLRHCAAVTDPNPLQKLISQYEKAAEKVQQEKNKAVEFIKSYKQS